MATKPQFLFQKKKFSFMTSNNRNTNNSTQSIIDENYFNDVFLKNLDKIVIGIIAVIILSIAIFNLSKS